MGIVKVFGIPGGMPKFVEKTWISRVVNAKKRLEGHGKIDWKSRGSTPIKLISAIVDIGRNFFFFFFVSDTDTVYCIAD